MNTLGTFSRNIAIIMPGSGLVRSPPRPPTHRSNGPRMVNSTESAITSRLTRLDFHALMAHRNAVGHP